MSACSDPTYEPGPVAELDLDGFDGTLEPPFATPIARSFASQTGSWLTTLDASFAALELEQTLDVGGDVLGAIGGIGSGATAVVNQEANAHLKLAEQGYETARAGVGELKSWLPPDVISVERVFILLFKVTDAGGAPIAGATVTIDADFGTGTTRVTKANGVTDILEVQTFVTVGWLVTAPGHPPIGGATYVNSTLVTQPVTLP